jgi:hypothetical protein
VNSVDRIQIQSATLVKMSNQPSPYPAAPVRILHYRKKTDEDHGLPNARSKFVLENESTDWSQFPTPLNKHWRTFVPEAKKILDSEGLDALMDTLDSKPSEQTRWVNDLLPQIERVLRKGKKDIILVLGFCPKCNSLDNDLDHTKCKTTTIVSGLELPDGPVPVLLNLRKDCIRHCIIGKGADSDEYCLPLLLPEFQASLPHLIFELYIVCKIFELQISSVVAFSGI